jgi:hypothetical protein
MIFQHCRGLHSDKNEIVQANEIVEAYLQEVVFEISPSDHET